MRLPDDLTIVIPAKDEARTIVEIVRAARAYAHRVIVVDGQSHDGTDSLAQSAGAVVVVDNGRGKGDAIRCVVPHLNTAIVVFMDADGSHHAEDIPALVDPILRGTADHVSASRLKGGSSELHGGFDEFLRLAGSSFITACINRRFGVVLSDTQNGFRALRTAVLQSLEIRENSTAIEQEMVIRTLLLGYKMDEVPSHEFRRKYGRSHINIWRDSPRYAWNLARNLARRRKAAPSAQRGLAPSASDF